MTRAAWCGLAVAVAMATAGLQAQGGKMDKMDKMDGKMPEKTYSGCIERTENGGFTLAHPMAADPMMKKSMDMEKKSMAMEPKAEAAASPLSLSAEHVDLSKHVGHKVSVKGVEGDKMGGMSTFTVKSLKMIAASCS